MESILIEYPTDWTDYELIDTGNGEKLERFGPQAGGYTVVRPDPRVLWTKSAPPDVWQKADAQYIRSSATEGHWKIKHEPPKPWQITYRLLTFTLRPTEFKHIGVFPEQAVNWDWLAKIISHQPLKVLNLFAYTGGATLAAAQAGAHVTHVDSAKGAIDWARQNAVASKLEKKPIRWIEEDVYKFVLRETRRGNKYDAIIMDPPRFGRGTQGEVWKLEKDLPRLLAACKELLSPQAKFVLINAYTADISSIALVNAVNDLVCDLQGQICFGELALQESQSKRLLPNGIFARWLRD